jgi:hypothetical protein
LLAVGLCAIAMRIWIEPACSRVGLFSTMTVFLAYFLGLFLFYCTILIVKNLKIWNRPSNL